MLASAYSISTHFFPLKFNFYEWVLMLIHGYTKEYFMHRINLLRHYTITPVVVFDGGNIPCKAATEQDRQRKRKANLDLAMEKLKEGNVSAASELFQRSVIITPSMAHQLIQILRSENIEFVVAPYEADAQLAYLSSLGAEQGGIVTVITEDSDLLAYGCQAVVFKMDRYGNGEEIVLDRVFDSVDRAPSFQKFEKELFIGMCVLAGCDFLPSVPGIGIVRAHSLVSKYRNLDRVLSILKFDKGNQMPEDYAKFFKEAVAVFQHARIYDPRTKRLKHMKPIPQSVRQSLDGDLDFLGPDIPPSIATAIAEGKLDPTTMEAFDHFPSSGSYVDPTIIQTSGRSQQPKEAAVPTQERCFTVFSSCKTKEEKTRVKEPKPAAGERKYLSEAVALAQMVLPLEGYGQVGTTRVTNGTPLKVPDNNPFRKRKLVEVQVDQTQSITEQVSGVTKVESLHNSCMSLNSQETVDSTPKRSNGKER
ncbi:exonuclease 1 isoform X2 [Malania oleifera]|uniref:exonuclease 1 isoform X2 n=1 Tax=Malania oleifera TaxID=397392 RepID=UPI0025AEA7E9|nr:exonuclease 1 isoform X2 [Malania oleifera]